MKFLKKICCKRRTFLRGILSSEEQQEDEERIKFGWVVACKNHGKFLNLTISVFSPFKVCVCVLFLKEQIFVFKVFFLSLSLIINYDTTQLFDVALGGLLDNSFFF